MNESPPEFKNFYNSPDLIRHVAPETMIYTQGGTRRRAILDGLSDNNFEFVQHTRQQMLDNISTIFSYGIKNVIMILFTDKEYSESGHHRDLILNWSKWFLVSDEAIADWTEFGWGIRLIGGKDVLDDTADQLIEKTPLNDESHTIWWMAGTKPGEFWQQIIKAIQNGAKSREEIDAHIFGKNIPPAKLFLGFGKPLISENIMHPIIVGKDLQMYWRQKPGYSLTSVEFVRTLYDYAYLRQTWIANKDGRANEVEKYREIMDRDYIVGLGSRLGPFWYPVTDFDDPDDINKN